MANVERKKKMNDKTVRAVICAAMYAALALFIVGLFLFNAEYTKIYDSPQVRSGTVDFDNKDITARDVACNLAGEWEFFYNKWIVTDGEACSADGMISLPDVWTWKDFGNGRLSKSGFGSYRLYAYNVQPDIDLIVYHHYSNFAYRTFINGQLTYASGVLSKDVDGTVVTGRIDERRPYRTDGGVVEIVIEVSANDTGGFNSAPWLAATVAGVTYGTSLRSFNYVALGITTAAVLVSILTFLFLRYNRDVTIPAFMLALYVHFLLSKDMLYVFDLPTTAAMTAELVSAIAAFALLALHLYRVSARYNMFFVVSTVMAGLIFTSLLLAYYGTPIAPVFAFLLIGAGCVYLMPFMLSRKQSVARSAVYGVLFIFLMSIFIFEFCDWLGLVVFGTEFIFTFELMLIIGCFTALWLWKWAMSARAAICVSELECELSSLKSKALQAQIKPHFVFNSLTAIQARYRDGMREGDKAIEQFAAHLRLITDSNADDLIPFDDEVRNVLNYFELENLRSNEKLNLMLDLNYTDFRVPVLSIQPFVENAIRHGGLRERQNGYIVLASDKTDGKITVTVTDNGKGFDTDAVRAGVGIENTRKRFELIKASVSIESRPDRGTRVTVELPSEE